MGGKVPTFVERFIRQDVCSHKGPLFVPLIPAIMLVDIFQPVIFSCAWVMILFFWVILWFIVPCNPNLNCTVTGKKGKDGIKALMVAFLIVYGILIAIVLAARIIVCVNPTPGQGYGGGIFDQAESIFTMDKVKKGGVSAHAVRDEINPYKIIERAETAVDHKYGIDHNANFGALSEKLKNHHFSLH